MIAKVVELALPIVLKFIAGKLTSQSDQAVALIVLADRMKLRAYAMQKAAAKARR